VLFFSPAQTAKCSSLPVDAPPTLAKLKPTTMEEKCVPLLDLSLTHVVYVWPGEQEEEDKMRATWSFPMFSGILISFSSFISCPLSIHPK